MDISALRRNFWIAVALGSSSVLSGSSAGLEDTLVAGWRKAMGGDAEVAEDASEGIGTSIVRKVKNKG